MKFKTIEENQPIRLVFLGCGFATHLHSKTLRNLKNVNCFYASRSPEKAKAYCEKYGGAGHFESYSKAIASPEIDVVFIATPPDCHLELALQSLRAGKHLLIEKPPFFKSTDFDLIRAEQKKTKVQAMVAENYFYKPLLKKLRQLIQSDVIGDLRFLYFNATKTQTTGNWRDENAKAGGGALFEGGIHWVNFISNLGLKIESVKGFQPGTKITEKLPRMERSIQVVAKYKEGPVGTLLYSWEVNALFKGLRLSKIYGTRGSITFESNGLYIFVRGKKWRFIFPGLSDIAGYKGMFQDFFKALHKGEEPAFNLALAQRDLEVIESVYASLGNG